MREREVHTQKNEPNTRNAARDRIAHYRNAHNLKIYNNQIYTLLYVVWNLALYISRICSV